MSKILTDLFKKTRYISVDIDYNEQQKKLGPLVVCPFCKKSMREKEYAQRLHECQHCGKYGRLNASQRLSMTVDEGSFQIMNEQLTTVNPLGFAGYEEKIAALQEKTGCTEAVVTGVGTIQGEKACIGIMNSEFLMASMGSVVGERLTRLFEYATEERLPVIIFCASGGARMHEGILSLMQMAKVSGAAGRHSQAGLLYITVLTDPTTGGVTASFAMLGDIILAEKNATIGFAGRRVIEGTIGTELPKDFQTAEFVEKHGFVDKVVTRKELKEVLGKILKLHRLEAGN